MNNNLTTVPATTSGLVINPDSTALFDTLGYFWQRIFQDLNVIKGMTAAQTDSVLQGYFKMVELINGYSCYNIPVFETRRWYPLFVYRSSLNNALLFGEGVLFGAEVDSSDYLFGSTIPETGTNTVSMLVPEELELAPFIADQIVAPKHVLTSGTDYNLINGRLTFNYNPFLYNDIPVQNVYNVDGTISTYTYYDSGGAPHTANDQLMILWVYNANLDSTSLDYNIGYLFGLNVPHSNNGRDILTTVVQNYTNGCTITDIKSLALASVGLSPYTTESETGLPTYNDVPDSVQLFDNVNTPGWWSSDLALFNNSLIPLQLPKTMLYGTYKHNIQFVNTVGHIYLNSVTGAFTVDPGMILGDQSDINQYLKTISTTAFQTVLENYLGHTLESVSYTGTLNLVDFMFKSFLRTTTALLRIKFTSTDQLANFVNYFDAVKSTLPPYIILMVLCDYSIPNEIIELNQVLNDTATTTEGNGNLTNGLMTANVLEPTTGGSLTNSYGYTTTITDDIKLNGSGSNCLKINDMTSSRSLVFFSSIVSDDIRNISFTVAS